MAKEWSNIPFLSLYYPSATAKRVYLQAMFSELIVVLCVGGVLKNEWDNSLNMIPEAVTGLAANGTYSLKLNTMLSVQFDS